ncbi:peptide ABC transporter substrate-binding protein [Candidatus Epulonipiscium viviparus]|uniref:peptide ABC transporter substrate-binding protein n=1 Tax=Candidatus Epulonipiscium viviparus TaxID=420336 RepID=UPI0027380A60|nr:peptide ABC transporter substrate-binding protein [Candidatus Epulopiscium viviparus]
MNTKLLTALLITAATLTACSGEDAASAVAATNETKLSPDGYPVAQKQELVYNLGAEPLTIDPQLNSAVDGSQIINNTFEGLVREVNGKLVPAMAESWTVSDDERVYTFKIRDDAMWSDGEPVTAHNFVFGWRRVVDPAVASGEAYVMSSAGILNAAEILAGQKDYTELGVKALDDKTLEVTLINPTAYFLEFTSVASFMPAREDIADSEGVWARTPETAVSNGPFKLSEYAIGDEIVLTKNEYYWNADAVSLDKVICKLIVSASAAYPAYQADQLDIVAAIPPAEIPKLIVENPEFYVIPYIGTYFMIMNLNNEVFQDINVRKALNWAIDRTTITEIVGAGQIPATGFIGPGYLDTDGNEFHDVAGDYGIPLRAEPEAAQKFLADAGYPNGEGFPEIEILYNTNDGHKLIAEAMQEMWSENLGIDVTLKNQEWAVFQETRNQHAYDFIARHGWIGSYADPTAMLDIFMTGSAQNNGGYSNATFDKHMHLARTTVGKERMDHLYKAEETLMTDIPIIPVYYYVNTLLVDDDVEGWVMDSKGKLWFGDIVMLDLN